MADFVNLNVKTKYNNVVKESTVVPDSGDNPIDMMRNYHPF